MFTHYVLRNSASVLLPFLVVQRR